MPLRLPPTFKRLEEKFTDKELIPVVQIAMEDAMEVAVDTMEDVIATSGSGKTWPVPTPRFWRNGTKSQPGEGRNDSGEMSRSVDYRVFISKKSTVRGEFGWINNPQKYFFVQEYGIKPGKHNMGVQSFVTGMQSMRRAREVAWDVFRDRVEREIERLYK